MYWEATKNYNKLLRPDFRLANFDGLRQHLGGINWEEFVPKPSREGEIPVSLNDERLNFMGTSAGRAGSLSSHYRISRKSDQVELSLSKFINEINECQTQFIPLKHIRCEQSDPRWMTNAVKYKIGLKRGIYKRMKEGETNLRDRYFQLAREVKNEVRKAKRNYEISVARQAKVDPKLFFPPL